MSQILRFHEPAAVVVPRDVVCAVDWMFAVSDHQASEFGLEPDEIADLESFVASASDTDGPVVSCASLIAKARNVLDSWALSSGCEATEALPADAMLGESCGFCMWCQSLVGRDWLDLILNEAGHLSASPYLDAWDRSEYDPEALWRRLMGPATAAA